MSDRRSSSTRRLLLLMMAAYVALFTWFSYRRHMSFRVGEWDTGIFDQSFWTAAMLGMPFYNTYEDMSHFGFHNSPVLVLLLPFYMLAPSPTTLFLLQSVALALGAVPVYLLARDLIGPRSGLLFAGLYLLNFPMHGINYHDFHETAFVVAPFLFALWGLRTGRRAALWLGVLFALAGREDMGVLVFGMGLLGLYRRRVRRSGGEAGGFERCAPTAAECWGLMLVGIAWTWVSFGVVMPTFAVTRGGMHSHSLRYSHLGEGPLQWLLSPLMRPEAFWGRLLTDRSLSYVLGLVAPLAFLPLRALPTFLVMSPVLVLNLVSSFGGQHLFTSHYAGPLIPFVFAAGIEGASHVLRRRGEPASADTPSLDVQGLRLLRPALALTLATMLAFDPSPLHVGWKVKPIDDHARVLAEVAASIPPDASVATQPNIWPHLDHRLYAYPTYRPGVDYIVIDLSPHMQEYGFVHEGGFDAALPPLLQRGEYALEREVDGVRVYRRAPRGHGSGAR